MWITVEGNGINGEWASLYYYTPVRAYINYYLSGGIDRITEYKVKRASRNGFPNLENAKERSLRSTTENGIFHEVEGLREAELKGKASLYDVLEPYMHGLNWQRIRRTK